MESLELAIDLDRPEPRYRPGESLSGSVRIHADSRSFGRALVVAFWWETTGGGDVDRGTERTIQLAPADGPIGGATLPFAFDVPAGPLSYYGRNFAITWIVEARLSAPESVGERVRTLVVVEPDPTDRAPAVGAEQLDEVTSLGARNRSAPPGAPLPRTVVERLLSELDHTRERNDTRSFGCCSVILLWGLFIGALTMPAPGPDTAIERAIAYGSAVLGVVLVVVTAWAILRSLRTRNRLGLHVGLATRLVRAGEPLVCTVRISPDASAEIASVEATLVATEWVRASSAGGPEAVTVELYRASTMISGPQSVAAGAREAFEGRLDIPADAPASFSSAHHRVSWEAQVCVVTPGSLPLVERLRFVVHPGGPAPLAPPAFPVHPTYRVF
jgi:hypothetical protein